VHRDDGECFVVVWVPTVSRRALGDVSAVRSGTKIHSCYSGRGIKRLLLCQARYDGNANLPNALRHWAVGCRCFERTWCRNIQVSGGPTAVKESHSFVTSAVVDTDERPASRFGRIVPRYALYRKAGCSVALDTVSTFRRPVAGLGHQRPWFDLGPVRVGSVVDTVALGQVSPCVPFHQFSTYRRRCMLSATTHSKTLVPAWDRHQILSSRNQTPISFAVLRDARRVTPC